MVVHDDRRAEELDAEPATSVRIDGVNFTTGAVEVDLSNTNKGFDADALARQVRAALSDELEVTVKTS